MVRRINRNLPAIQAHQRRGLLKDIGNVVKSAVSDLPAPLTNILKGTVNLLFENIGKNLILIDPIALEEGKPGGPGGPVVPKKTKGGEQSKTPSPKTPPLSGQGSAPHDKTHSPGKASPTSSPHSSTSLQVGGVNGNGSNTIPQQPATTQLIITPTSTGTIGHDSTAIPILGGMASEGKSASSTSGPLAEDQSQSPSLKTSITIVTETGTDGRKSTYTSTIVSPSELPTFVSEHRNQLTAGPVVGIVIIVLGILTCATIILVWVMKRRRRIRFMYQEETTQMTSNAILLMDQGSDRWSYATTESQFSIGLHRNGSYSANSVGPLDERVSMTQYGSEQRMSVVPSYIGLQQNHCPITAGSTADLDDPFITPPTSPQLTAMESSSLPTTRRSEHLEAKAAMPEIVETLAVRKRELREKVSGRLIGSPSGSQEPV